MSERFDVHSGARVGRWTVLFKDADSSGAWQCRCDCGTERSVKQKTLHYGESMSCGCLRKEKANQSVAHDLKGKRFGRFTVLEQAETRDKRRGRWWKCICDCGNEVDVLGTLLVTGRKTSCGCDVVKNYAYADITGQKFNRLTALYPLKERSGKGGMVWHCRCECGNEIDVPYNDLMYSNLKSCGCQKREHDMKLKELLPHVDGTSISHLRSTRTPRNNTTGVKGVYYIRGRYVAKIVFQKKQYYLGAYDTVDEAADARKMAESELNGRVTAFYDCWQALASANPQWGKENPMRISVERYGDIFNVVLSPDLEEIPKIDIKPQKLSINA